MVKELAWVQKIVRFLFKAIKKSDLHKLRGQYKTTQRSASCHTLQRKKVFMEQQSSGLRFCYIIATLLKKNVKILFSFPVLTTKLFNII